MKTLLIDDDELNRDLQARIIRRLGHEVDTAENGEEGLDLLATRNYDIVFLDCLLPGISGVEVLQEIRAKDADHQIVIALTGAIDDHDYLTLGFDDLMEKPISIEDFKVVLQKWQKA